MPGRLLHRWASRFVDEASVRGVIEPLIADFQREWRSADGAVARTIVRVRWCGAFLRTLVICAGRSAYVESRPFQVRAAMGFAVAVCLIATIEGLWAYSNAHAFVERTGLTVTIYRLGLHFTYFAWDARRATFTLRFGVPLAMFAAMRYARTTDRRLVPAVGVMLMALGVLLTLFSPGWLVPSLQRSEAIRMHEEANRRFAVLWHNFRPEPIAPDQRR